MIILKFLKEIILNGKKNGKGKEFNKSGKIIFEGEYLNGKRIEGKGYNKNGNVILKIRKNGKGKNFMIIIN